MVAELSERLREKSEDADFGKALRESDQWMEIRAVAQGLMIEVRPGKKLGRNQLYNFLMNTGMVEYPKDWTSGKRYYKPIQAFEDRGYLKLGEKSTGRENSQGEEMFDHRLLIGTEKGVPYIQQKMLKAKEEGVLDDLCKDWREARGWDR